MDNQELIETLENNTSLDKEEAEQFINILNSVKDISNIDILDEYGDNWSAHDNYEEAWEDEQQYLEDDEIIEEEFKQHSYILSSGRCLVRDYK